MLREFLDSSRRLMVDMKDAVQAGRIHDLERTAHTLKSMAHMVGARDLEDTCRDLEMKARVSSRVPTDAMANLFLQLQQAQGAVERFLP